MSNLWKTATHPYGEPSENYVSQTKHDYLRAHYDDPEWSNFQADRSVHDHFDHQGHQYQGRPHEPGCTGDARTCQHGPTERRIRDIAQQNWTISHEQLLDPQAHQQRRDRQSAELSGFLSDYALDHPDRVFNWHEDGSTSPIDDPRLGGS